MNPTEEKILADLSEYTKDIRKHVSGRFALIIAASKLPRHLNEPHYRRQTAAAFRPLVERGSKIFSLPNYDMAIITNGSTLDDIERALVNVRHELREAPVIQSLDPVQGITDAFTQWFDLEKHYEQFATNIKKIITALKTGTEMPVLDTPAAQLDLAAKGTNPKVRPNGEKQKTLLNEVVKTAQQDMKKSLASNMKKVQYVPIEAPLGEKEERLLDPELLLQLKTALQSMDATSFVRKQKVMAIIGTQAPLPILEHRYTAMQILLDDLLPKTKLKSDAHLSRYLEELLIERMLVSRLDMSVSGSVVSSIRATSHAVLNAPFDTFEKSLGAMKHNKIVIEFSILDIMSDPSLYVRASVKLKEKGYKICIADIQPFNFLWFNHSALTCDFLKLHVPSAGQAHHLSAYSVQIRTAVKRFGNASVILSGVDTKSLLETGKEMGISLFQGSAVSQAEQTS